MSISRHLPRSRTPLLALLTGITAFAGVSVVPAAAGAPVPEVVTQSAPSSVWQAVDEQVRRSNDGDRRRIAPAEYAGYHLDLPTLSRQLDGGTTTIEVPAPSGELVEFAVAESPVMEADLAAAHPEIATYAGRSTSSAAPASIRLDVTPMGFHAAVRGAGSSWYVDPAYNGLDQGPDALYLAYDADDLPERQQPLIEPELESQPERATTSARRIGEGQGAVATQRTYRLALVSDPSYAAYFTSSSDPTVVDTIVTAEKVTLMNRVNQLYGDDFSITMVLVGGNDALNFNTDSQFLGANGRCGQLACYRAADVGCGDVIDTNRFVVGQIIGADNYDIGHVMFGPDGSGGGVAYLGAVGTYLKAGGCTGLDPPTGDGFAIDYVAHEMGHQFAGNHTFNGTKGSCAGGTRNAGTSVEPGSGSSVMAYAGICGADDLQPHTDPYFSQRTQTEVAAFTRAILSNDNEIQNVALSGFGSGESFTISYGGAPGTVTSGSNYTAAGIKAAVEAAEPSGATATVTGFWGRTSALTNGFQITWSGSADIPTPTVEVASGTFSSIVGTTDNGGAEDNGGFQNPTPTGNRNPVVTAPPARTIPIRTPFELTGSATDPDDDALIYLWEQNNPGTVSGTALVGNTKTNGPLFRVFGTYADVTSAGTEEYESPGENLATTSPTRSFPDITQVVAGTTNAESGSCPSATGTSSLPNGPALDCYSEQLPTVLYTPSTMTFRLTARDLGGADGGVDGGTSYADTVLTLAKNIGPFLVTSQETATAVTGGESGTITWSNTTSSLAADVKISFSTDGGLTYPTVLLESTPNDGSQAVTWPNVATSQGRVKVEAVDNYFYDINNAAISITPGTPVETLTIGGNTSGSTFGAASSDPLTSTPVITAESSSVDGSAITISAPGLPSGLSLTRTGSSTGGDRPGTTTFEVTGNVSASPGSYPVTVTVSDGVAPDRTTSFTIEVTQDEATLTYTGDTTATAGDDVVDVTVSTSVEDTDATPATVAGSVAFTDATTGDDLCVAPVTDAAATCTFGADVTGTSRTYEVVGTLTSTHYTGASDRATLVVTVEEEPGDTTPPETTIVSGPRDGRYFLGEVVDLGYASSEAGSTFTCSLATYSGPCPDSGQLQQAKPRGGAYEFSVAATDASGNTDLTPATRRYFVPVNDRALKTASGPWKRRKNAGAFRGTFTTVARKGAQLRYRVSDVTSLVLVTTKAPGSGAISVYLGKKKLRTFKTSASKTRRKVVSSVATFSAPTSGVVRIRTKNSKRVSIEGLGTKELFTDDRATRSFVQGGAVS